MNKQNATGTLPYGKDSTPPPLPLSHPRRLLSLAMSSLDAPPILLTRPRALASRHLQYAGVMRAHLGLTTLVSIVPFRV